ncbi:MAG: UvrD-helicase domain-containing protein [Oligoflexia bacterium]|nr:UvrD-helicase domain-containing protein [Oligoflexia bacterium]
MQSQTPLVSKIIQAGAGTGKTESLALEVIEVAKKLYTQKQELPQIVATTFTEQATVELRQRIIEVALKQKAEPWLQDFVRDIEHLQISTIHGVFAKILHRHGPLMGLDPEFGILKAEEERQVVRKCLRKLMTTNQDAHFIADQYGFEGAVSVLIQLMSHYHLHGINAKPLLNWEDLLKKDLDVILENLKIINAASLNGLTEALSKTLDLLKRIYSQISRLGADYEKIRNYFLQTLEGVRTPTIKTKGLELKDNIKVIFEMKKKWSDEAYDVVNNAKFEQVSKVLANLSKLLMEKVLNYKITNSRLSFSDLELLTRDLLSQHPNVQTQIQNFYDFWFIDEFQDTSPLQKQILYNLFKKPWNVYFVGDPQQSIYLFRGADKNVFEETKQKILIDQKGKLEELITNYRSSGDIIKFFNKIFSPLKAKEDPKNIDATKIYFHNKLVEANSIIAASVFHFLQEGFNYDGIGILVRTNKEANDIAQYLTSKGLPVYVHSSGGFYEKREVLDALYLLDFILDPHQDDVFCVLARSPWLNIPDQTLVDWGQELKKLPLKERPSFWKYAHQFENENIKILNEILSLKESKALSFVFETALSRFGFFEFSAIDDMGARREANLRKFLSDLRASEAKEGFNAFEFIFNAKKDADKLGEEKEAISFIEPQKINIMTIHKSKGLKFDCVVVAGCERAPRQNNNMLELSSDGSWAIQVLSENAEQKVSPLPLVYLKKIRFSHEALEFMRLFYVATTRAAERLVLVSEAEPHEQSWLAQLKDKLNYNSGVHDNCYEVKYFEEPIEIKRYELARGEVQDNVNWQKKFPIIYESTQKVEGRKPIASNVEEVINSQIYGTEFHKVFEVINKNPKIEYFEAAKIAKTKKIKMGIIEKLLQLNDIPLKEILSEGVSEMPFSFKHKDKVYSGRIDLWAKINNTVWLIDFKTGEDPHAERQLKFYAYALSQTGIKWEQIKAVIVYPLKAKSKKIDLGKYEELLIDFDSYFADHCLDQI